MKMKTIGMELYDLCKKKEDQAHNQYSAAYNAGGPEYEVRMKAAAHQAKKWSRRAQLALTSSRFQDALIETV